MNSSESEQIRKLYAEAELWHGTGRYRYAESGGIEDIWRDIIAAGALVPHEDDWDRKRGKIRTISTARARMYARLYAGMYSPFGRRIGNEIGWRHLWGYYFFGTAEVVALFEYPFARPIPDYRRKLVKWTHKVSKGRSSLTSIFIKGTDIPSNYPILIGIKRGIVQPTDDSLFFSLHEERSGQPISLDDLTHIEVPQERVEETTALLRGAGFATPVIPIEQGEGYCRTFSLWQLVNGKPLMQV